jgi:hypothetical protein
LQHHRHPMPDLVLRYGGHRAPCQHRLHWLRSWSSGDEGWRKVSRSGAAVGEGQKAEDGGV